MASTAASRRASVNKDGAPRAGNDSRVHASGGCTPKGGLLSPSCGGVSAREHGGYGGCGGYDGHVPPTVTASCPAHGHSGYSGYSPPTVHLPTPPALAPTPSSRRAHFLNPYPLPSLCHRSDGPRTRRRSSARFSPRSTRLTRCGRSCATSRRRSSNGRGAGVSRDYAACRARCECSASGAVASAASGLPRAVRCGRASRLAAARLWRPGGRTSWTQASSPSSPAARRTRAKGEVR